METKLEFDPLVAGPFSPLKVEPDTELTRLRAENHRLREDNEALTKSHNTSLLRAIDQLKLTVLRQQIELTKVNRAMMKKNRLNRRLRDQLTQHKQWAISMPLDQGMAHIIERRISSEIDRVVGD